MNRIESIEKISELVSIIRNYKKGFITNFYLDLIKHQVWIDNNSVYYLLEGETCLIFKINNDFFNLFYFSTNENSLKTVVSNYISCNKSNNLIIDIVGIYSQLESIIVLFEKIGFIKYKSLVRMYRITPNSNSIEIINYQNICFAKREDSIEVFNLLNQYFDNKSEQIPYLEELKRYSDNNNILLYKENDKILGFVIYEMSKSTLYLRYWFVHPDYRDKKIGSKLLNSFFNEGRNTKRQLFWVMTDNDNAIKRYEHYGFKNENMYDNILIMR